MTESKPRTFSPQAAKRWASIPLNSQESILANVYCTNCHKAVQIVNFTGNIELGDLLLRGNCAVCKHKVVRLVEKPEL